MYRGCAAEHGPSQLQAERRLEHESMTDIVFCPKYRRPVLVGDVEQRLKHVLYATAQQYGVLIETMETMPDQVHLFVTADPTGCVAEIQLFERSKQQNTGRNFLI